jgi:magnesium-transporting ATPase (P-type)
MTNPPAPSVNPPVSPNAGIAAWRVLFRMLAGFIALFCFAFWAAAGWNLGWTKTQIAVKQIDAITGIEFITYKKHFMPGVELLALGVGISVALFAVTFLRRARSHT